MPKLRLPLLPLVLLASTAVWADPTGGQEPYAPEAVTAEDYARAERFLRSATRDLVHGTEVSPNWMENGRFW